MFFMPLSFFSQDKKKVDSISNLTVPYIHANLKIVIPVLKKNAEDAKKIGNTKAEAKTYGLLALALELNGDYDCLLYTSRCV